jgi:hypothetical protein
MPRKHRAARERSASPGAPERPRAAVPEWAHVGGFTVRGMAGDRAKSYRCPGCQQEIHPGTAHLVVVTDEDVEGRRHWHTPCWRRELRRLGHRA